MGAYTNASIVNKAINSKTSLADLDIELIINNVESKMSMIMKSDTLSPSGITWDDKKYGILRECATAGTILQILATTPESMQVLAEMQARADLYYSVWREDMSLLEQQDYVNRLEAL